MATATATAMEPWTRPLPQVRMTKAMAMATNTAMTPGHGYCNGPCHGPGYLKLVRGRNQLKLFFRRATFYCKTSRAQFKSDDPSLKP